MSRQLHLLLRFVTGQVWRTIIFVVGVAIVLIGVVLLPLPGPGTLVIALGLAILSAEFVWARHGLVKMKAAAERIRSWAQRTPRSEGSRPAKLSAAPRKRPIRIRRPA